MSDYDRRPSSDRRHHHHRYSRDRDYSDDSYRREPRRVPGLVTDPADKEIRRGQQETMERYKTDSYYSKDQGRSKITKDTMSQPYNVSSTQPYYPQSHRNASPFYSGTTTKTKRSLGINPSLLSCFGGIVGVGLIIAAIVIVDWYVRVSISTDVNVEITTVHIGLFQTCTYTGNNAVQCRTVENYTAATGNSLSDLEQASRGLIIIAVVFGFTAVVLSIMFGIRRFERRRGAYYTGAAFLLAGFCAVSAMGCYSKVVADAIGSTTVRSSTQPGTSFYISWFGTTLFLISAVISFLSNATSWRP